MPQPDYGNISLWKPFVNRIEVIDETGRIFVGYFSKDGCDIDFQDDGRTIKIFKTGTRTN